MRNNPEERRYHLLRGGSLHSQNAMLDRTHEGKVRLQNLDIDWKMILKFILRKSDRHTSYI